VLESLESVFVDFTMPQQELARVPVGAATEVVLPGTNPPQKLPGKIAAVDPNVDAVTRSVKLRTSVEDEKAQLRPGMFVNVSVLLPEQVKVIAVPATAILRAPYGDSVFVVEPRRTESKGDAKDKGTLVMGPDGKPAKVARQQFVRLGPARGDFVAIEDGVKPGQEVVTQGAFKLRNGAPIMVNNSVKLTPSLTPRPENR
jgi:membrane fusion protein (multidrug efflux system)